MNKCLYCYNDINGDADFHEECALKFFGSKKAPELPYTINEMEVLAKNVVERSISVPGVQPKLSMSVIDDALNKSQNRLTVVGALGGDYIFKPPSNDYPELPQNEHVTMRIAESFGIRVVPSSLISLSSGELAFITKRIDRTGNGDKVHMLDMYQITEAFEKYKGSMEKVGKALGEYSSNPMLDKIFLFELVLFSFLTGNNDMHLKNFSMIETNSGWVLAPAYDLLNVSLALPEDKEEMALTLSGKKTNLSGKSFLEFGKSLGLTEKQINGVFERFSKKIELADMWLKKSFLSKSKKEAYRTLLAKRFKKIN